METLTGGPQISVLVVEDNQPFSEFVCSVLREHSQLRVVGQSRDGSDAVCQAKLLRPELITMDIGLPGLNGIAAALRIRKFLPDVKIIFLTQESSEDVMRECLEMGGCAYVRKLEAGHELSRALETVNGVKGVPTGVLECYGSAPV